jgi:thymidylate synthase (FAD)
MRVTLVQSTPNPITTIATIASICYDSDPKNPLGLVKHLYKNGHHSVFEHIYFTFKIEGISRACSHQLVRHRMCSFTQRSQRYCSEDGFSYREPLSIREKDMRDGYDNLMQIITENYEELIAQGIPNEDARFILPNACCTELYLSCNLRELIHMANERLCVRSQWEIRELVHQMVTRVDPDLQFMLVPKCQSGYLRCNEKCDKNGHES